MGAHNHLVEPMEPLVDWLHNNEFILGSFINFDYDLLLLLGELHCLVRIIHFEGPFGILDIILGFSFLL